MFKMDINEKLVLIIVIFLKIRQDTRPGFGQILKQGEDLRNSSNEVMMNLYSTIQ